MRYRLECPELFYVSVSVERDMKERERPLEQILHQYITYVKPAFEEFCLPVST